MIGIVDYGMGNLASVTNAFEKINAEATVTSDERKIQGADAIVLPGVGAFGSAMRELARIKETLLKRIEDKIPFLGICLGMQMFFEMSEESKGTEGLAVLSGECVRFPETVKVPQTGWNQLKISRKYPLFKGVPQQSYAYFTNSYYCLPDDKDITASKTTYGIEFASAVRKGNIFGVQFHPEKSGAVGLRMLKNFVELAR